MIRDCISFDLVQNLIQATVKQIEFEAINLTPISQNGIFFDYIINSNLLIGLRLNGNADIELLTKYLPEISHLISTTEEECTDFLFSHDNYLLHTQGNYEIYYAQEFGLVGVACNNGAYSLVFEILLEGIKNLKMLNISKPPNKN